MSDSNQFSSNEDVVYKYLGVSAAKAFFCNSTLRVTPPLAFNDPYDCAGFRFANPSQLIMQHEAVREQNRRITADSSLKPEERMALIESRRSKLKRLTRSPNLVEDEISKTVQQVLSLFSQKFGIICFCRECDRTPMWSYYADVHKGVCIGFNAKHEFFSGDRPGMEPLKAVKYREQKIDIIYDGGMKFDESSKDIVFSKSMFWEHEHELRMLFSFREYNGIIDAGVKCSKNFPVKLLEVPVDAVAEVIVGLDAERAILKQAKDYCDRYRKRLYESRLKNDNYKIGKSLVPPGSITI